MVIDISKLKQDESVSNPMEVGFRYPDCPINRKSGVHVQRDDINPITIR